MKKPTDKIRDIYSTYIDYKNEQNKQDRYVGNEHHYHASGAGTCSRKLYYQSVEQIEPTNLPNTTSYRLLRLGTVMHNDIQEALRLYNNNIYNNIIYSNKEKENYRKEKETKFHIEKEIRLEQLGVRGFYDCVMENDRVILIDFKTIGAYPWSRKFGYKHKDMNPPMYQEIQLATYGLYVQKEFGRLDGMYLYYYNKDNSKMRPVEVPMNMLKRAENFWINVNEEYKKLITPDMNEEQILRRTNEN